MDGFPTDGEIHFCLLFNHSYAANPARKPKTARLNSTSYKRQVGTGVADNLWTEHHPDDQNPNNKKRDVNNNNGDDEWETSKSYRNTHKTCEKEGYEASCP